MTAAFQDVIDHREFVKELVHHSLRARYRGSFLGFLWTLLTPLLFFISFTFVFSFINRADMRTFGIYFFSGYVPWAFFVAAASQATISVLSYAHLITRIRTPKMVYPAVVVIANCIDFLAGLFLIFVLMYLLGTPFTAALAILPLSFLLLLVFVAGMSYAFAAINVFMRDFSFIWNSINIIWFFCTPILYPIDRIPPHVRPYFELNPILPFIRMFQEPVCNGVLPSADTVLLAGTYAALAFVFGTSLYLKSQKSFYRYI